MRKRKKNKKTTKEAEEKGKIMLLLSFCNVHFRNVELVNFNNSGCELSLAGIITVRVISVV